MGDLDKRTVMQGGRRKAYRPLPPDARRAAFGAFLAACSRGDWFEAHELLEPAWMGTADPAERNLYQGLIKVAAANVHRDRGNALGMAKNLAGARDRLQAALEGGKGPADDLGIDPAKLISVIDHRLDRLGAATPVARVPAVPVVVQLPGPRRPDGRPG
jgi:hypothetical protein